MDRFPWQPAFVSRKKPSLEAEPLSKREGQIMDLLYRQGTLTVAQLADRFPEPLTRNALRTFLGILESKGHVTRAKEGREFIYSPATDRAVAAKAALSKVLDVFFKGSLSAAVAARFNGQSKPVDEAELRSLEELIAEARKQAR